MKRVFLAVLLAALFVPRDAYAMHLAEGILPLPWAAAWYAVALIGVALGLRDLRKRTATSTIALPLTGLLGAAVFVISCMPVPVPIAGTTSHPCGTGLAAIVVGPLLTIVIASVALVLQAVFLAHGGISTLGANIVSMGVVGGLAAYGAFRLARRAGMTPWGAAFAAGLVSDWATYAMTSFELSSALHQDRSIATVFGGLLIAFAPTQIPLGILEGLLTASAYHFIRSRRPELLERAMGGS